MNKAMFTNRPRTTVHERSIHGRLNTVQVSPIGPALDLVRQMRSDSLSDERARAQLKAKGFSKSRISQLLRAVPYRGKVVEESAPPNKRGLPLSAVLRQRRLAEESAPAKKRRPPITVDELRQLGEASALEAARELARSDTPISARLSCQYIGVSTGPDTYSSAAPPLGNSTLVYVSNVEFDV